MKSSNITRTIQKPFTAHTQGGIIHNVHEPFRIINSQCLDAHLGSPIIVSLVARVADLVEAVHGGDVFWSGGGWGRHLATKTGQILLVKLKKEIKKTLVSSDYYHLDNEGGNGWSRLPGVLVVGEVLPLDEVLGALLGDQGLDGVDVLLLQDGLDHLL